MFDPGSLDPGVKFVAHFILIVSIEFSTQESGDVVGFDSMDSGACQVLIDGLQVFPAFEDNIGSIFGFRDAPVILEIELLDKRAVSLSKDIEPLV